MKVASETERESLKQLDSRYMSDEEDGEEGEGVAWVVRSPPWRSQRPSSFLRRLQERVNSDPLVTPTKSSCSRNAINAQPTEILTAMGSG